VVRERRQPLGQSRGVPELDVLDRRERAQPQQRCGDATVGAGNRQHTGALPLKAIGTHPGGHGIGLATEPILQTRLGHQPQGTAVGGMGIRQELTEHGRNLNEIRALTGCLRAAVSLTRLAGL
jgi:hypothetical protein